MSTQTTNYLDIIERLPAGAKLELFHIDWDEYEHLLTQMESFHPGHRLSYDRGRLIVVSPKREHEFVKAFVSRVAHVLAEELGLDIEATGATTLRRRNLMKGVEADESFYVQNAAHMVGHLELDLDVDPPPDVAVEIDMSNDSLDKFPIYAALGVPEIWRYDGKNAHFYQLVGESYKTMRNSVAFPILTAEDFTRCLGQSKVEGQTATLKAFRQMLRSRASS
jgi:Uma2 family endonuclease